MTDLHAREIDPDDEEGPVVELVEEGRVVGVVYFDQDATYAEFHPDEDGDPWAFDVSDLQRVLDTARAMVDPDATFVLEGPRPGDGGDDPVDVIAARFDRASSYRGDEDEGFYPPTVVMSIIEACNELDLAVVSLEGATLDDEAVLPVSGHTADLGTAHAGEPWPVFRAGCNVHAEAILQRWATRDERFVVAVEVADSSGDQYVL
jgi:hypothetical protein